GGGTPLHVAASKGHAAVVRALVKAGADVTAPLKSGHTPLDVANGEAVATLLRESGHTPLDVANGEAVATLLREGELT
ncbi:hypothetical protein T484DRAFT_1781279, partial [Baffinella frigidus]